MFRLTRASIWVLSNRGVSSAGCIERTSSAWSRQLCSTTQVQDLEEEPKADNVIDAVEEHTDDQVGVADSSSFNRKRQRTGVRFNDKRILLRQLDALERRGTEIRGNAVYRFLISCGKEMYGETKQKKIQLVKDVWNRFLSKGVMMDVSHYNALLAAYVYNGHDFSPLDFLAEMEKSNVNPNYLTFITLIRAYCSKGDMQGALKVVEFMNKEKFSLTEILYSTLIEGYGKSGDISNALEVLSIMSENNCQPGLATYAALLGCYAEAGDMDGINKILQDMAWKNIVPTASTYLKTIDHLSQGGHQNLISQILEMVKDPEEVGAEGRELLKVMISRGDHIGALELADYINKTSAEERNETSSEKDLRAFIGNLYTASSSAENFLGVMKHFEEQGLRKTPIEDTLDYCYWKGDTDGAVKMINELFAAERPVKIHYFYPIVKTLADNKDFEGLKNVFSLLGKKRSFLDETIISLMKRGLEGVENINEVIADLAKQSGLELPVRAGTSLLQGPIASNDLNALVSILPALNNRTFFIGETFNQIEGVVKSSFEAEKAAQIYKLLNDKKILKIGSSIARVMDHITLETSEVAGKDAVKFIKDLMEGGVTNMPSKVYSKALALIYRDKLKDDFFEVVRLMKEHDIEADEHQYIQMLKMSSYIGNSGAAQFCFEKIKQSSIEPNLSMYCNLIAAYWADRSKDGGGVSDEHMLQITDIYEAMREKDLKPHKYVMSSILIAYLTQQRIDDADEIMKELGPGYRRLHVYNAYLRAYAKAGRIEDAEKLFNWMKTDEDAPKPTHNSYHNLMSAYRVEGNVDRVRELMEEMKSGGLQHLKLTNMELIKSHLETKDFAGALDSLEAIDDEEAYPYEVMYKRIIYKLKIANDVSSLQRAKEIFRKQGTTVPSRKELDSLHAFLLIKSGQKEDAINLIKSDDWAGSVIEIKQIAEESPNDMMYLESAKDTFREAGNPTYVFDHALLRFYGKTNNVDKALLLYKDKVESGLEIAESFQNRLESLLEANGRELPTHPVSFGRRALTYLTEMLSAYRSSK